MEIQEFLSEIVRHRESAHVGYSITDMGRMWNVFSDQSTSNCWPCITQVYKVVGRDTSKPHSVIISLSIDPESGRESVRGWCGDTFFEGRLSGVEKARRQSAAIAWAISNFPGCDAGEVQSHLDSGYGLGGYKSAGCNFWARKDAGGCKHYRMALARVTEADLQDMRQSYAEAMGLAAVTSAAAKEIDKVNALRATAFLAPALIIGPPASGKTHSVRQLAESIDAEYIEYGCHDGTETTDLLGMTVPCNGMWVWKDGPVSEAFRKAAKGQRVVLLLDELLRMPRQQRSALLTAFGEYKGLYRLRTGRIVSEVEGVGQEETLSCAVDSLFLVCTTNAGAQFGIEDMDGALKSRFRLMYFAASEATIDEAMEAELDGKKWPQTDREWAKKALLDLMKKSELGARSAALASPLDLRAIKRIIASSCSRADMELAAAGERLQCAGLSKDGTVIAEQEDFYIAMVKKVFATA
jgi:MoxR-like ATPase